MTKQNLLIEPLGKYHKRTAFSCKNEVLDNYLKRQAGQDIKRHISRVFICSHSDNPTDILGYYTLSALSIEASKLPANLRKKLPKHPIPAALLGRLAINENHQGLELGKLLLVDAIKRTLNISDNLAIYAMIVDAIDENAKGFYEAFGFSSLPDNNSRLFLPLKQL